MTQELPAVDGTGDICVWGHLLAAVNKGLHERIFEAAAEPIMVFDNGMRAVLLNKAASLMYGGEQTAWHGKKCRDIFQSASGHCEKYPGHCWLKDVLDSGRPLRTITGQVLSGGKELRVAVSASPVFDEGGVVRNVVVFLRDVTGEYECREALDDLNRRRQLCEKAPDGIIRIDGRGLITDVNETGLRLFGYSREEMIDKLNICGLAVPEQKFLCDQAVHDLENGEAAKCTEMEWRRRDGATFWTRVKGMPLPRESGAAAAAVISIRDIDELPMEDTIDNPTRFARALLDSIGEGVFFLDTDYRILNTNRRFTEITGKERDQVLGKHCYEVSHYSEVPCWLHPKGSHHCPVKDAIESGEAESAVHTHYDKKRRPHFIELKAFPLKDRDGRVFQIIETHTDITEKKELESRLAQAEKMESIGNMAGGIAHDLNNILTPILGYAELETQGMEKDNPYHESFHEILNAARRASALVRQILAFSRRQVLDKGAVDLNEVINNLEKMLGRVIREDIDIQTFLDDGLWKINADRTHIEQIIVNLVVNARDAMPGGGKLIIETQNVVRLDSVCHTCGEPLAGSYVRLQVSDTGTGIDPEIMPHIFEPFYTTKGKGQGTGMGLATIMGIMHQHDGHVNVYSEPGMGSAFKIYFPRLAPDSGAGPVDEPRCGPADKDLAGSGETILIVDDNKGVRELLAKILVNFGYSVLGAANGEDAVEVFERHREDIALVLTDIVMPGMGGRELINRIHESSPSTPAVFMSGYSLNAVHHKFIMKKGIEYLQKPVTIDGLLAKVKAVLARTGG